MPRYYFHIRDHDRLILDEEGLECAGPSEAKFAAEVAADDLIKDAIDSGEDIRHQVIEVTLADGRVIAAIELGERFRRNTN